MSQDQSDLEQALDCLREKRDYFEKEKAQEANPDQKFTLYKKIQECDKEIKRLETEIANRNQKSSSSNSSVPKIPFILPQKDIPTFTGRDEELRKLEKQLINDQGNKFSNIVGLAGIGGIGKSALAYHFATKYKEQFPDGVIGLRVDGKDVNTIVRDFARHYGEKIDLEDERDAATIMQEMFAHRKMLLIFDNADEDNKNIKDLCVGGNRCAIIITTRDRQLLRSLNIHISATIDVCPLPQKDSLQLLKNILGEQLVEEEIEAANKIISLVGNLPLALQIAGATLWGRPRKLADYAAELKEEKNRLKSLKIRRKKELNVKASLSLSLRLLEEEEIDFFACLSVCAESGFSRRTAAIVGNFDDDEWEVQYYLDSLYELSLLNYSEVGENRFVFHPLIRLFAQSIAIERGLKDEAAARHARFFIGFVKSTDFNDVSNASKLAEEVGDIVVATQWLELQQSEDYKFSQRLHPVFQRYGYWKQAVNILSKYEQFAENRQNWHKVVKFRLERVKYLSLSNELSQAEELLEQFPQILAKIDDVAIQVQYKEKWLYELGFNLKRQERKNEAIEIFYQAIEVGEEVDKKNIFLLNSNHLGMLLQKQGKLKEATKIFQRQIKIAQSIDDKRSVVIGLNCLAGILQEQGKLEEAANTFQHQIEIAESIDDKREQTIALNGLAGILQEQGKLEKAANTFQIQIEIAESINDDKQQAIGLNGLAGVLKKQGKFKEAANTFQIQIEIAESIDDKKSQAIGLNGLAGVLQQQGQLEEAANTFQIQIEIAESIDDKKSQAIGLNGLAGVLQQQGQLEEAANTFQHQIEISQSIDDKKSQAIGLNALAGVFQQQGKLKEAEQILRDSQSIFEDLHKKRSLAMVLNSLGVLFKRQQRWKEAEMVLRKSFDLSVTIKDEMGQAIILNRLAQVLQKQGDENKFKLAIAAFKQSIKIGEKFNDQEHLAKVYTAMGQALFKQQNFTEAATAFRKGFEIDEKLANIRGLKIVTKKLTQALSKLGKHKEAINYCQRALAIAPQDKGLLALNKELSSSSQIIKRNQKKPLT